MVCLSLSFRLGLNSQGRSAHRAPLATSRQTGTQAKAPTCLAIMSGTPFDELGTPFDVLPFYGLGTPFDGMPFERLGTPFEGATFLRVRQDSVNCPDIDSGSDFSFVGLTGVGYLCSGCDLYGYMLHVNFVAKNFMKSISKFANPKGNLSGAKRKAVTPPAVVGASELPPVGLKKKLKEEWSCALCQVRATSERGLDEHLQGKKHKAMEAGLSAQRTGKNNAIGLFPKKTVKPIKLAETIDNQNSEQEILLQKSSAEDVKQNNDLALQVVKVTNDSKNNSKNKNWNLAHKTKKTGDCKEKRFKFWCEMCQVGASSMKVLGIHKKGKKHMARLQELNQKSGSALTTQVGEAPQKEKCPEVVVKDEKEETTDNVDGDADGEVVENHQTAEDVAGNGTN
ncbi:hypothetical protein TEA_011042 [Camellia sinensis var. sinensis]|uniref:U1-type domain-containing protein n=1 Tax=Camellia sinensis var. sinensis TaxID=542762 RepID=A0A4S4DMU8_CAMSN|nr:hypothetical protein TEA_011042 [Camellia sinensis var. sinensis]